MTNVATFTTGQPLLGCDVASWPATVLAGDETGRVHALRIENLPLGPAVVTAWSEPQRGGLLRRPSGPGAPTVRCPRCRAWSTTSAGALGSTIACASCGMPLLLNPFVIVAPRPGFATDARASRS